MTYETKKLLSDDLAILAQNIMMASVTRYFKEGIFEEGAVINLKVIKNMQKANCYEEVCRMAMKTALRRALESLE